MRGEYVIVRAFGNRALIKRVWSIGTGCVFVTSDDIYEKLLQGKTELMAIGFPTKDVFKYDADIAGKLGSKPDWSKLSRYQ